MKICTKCGEEKPNTPEFFPRKSASGEALRAACKVCRNKQSRENSPRYAEKVSARMKKRYRENKAELNAKRMEYRRANIEKERARVRRYNSDNRETINDKIRSYVNGRRKNEPMFRAIENIRRRINHAIKQGNKTNKTFDLLGCSRDEVRLHIERQFEQGMSWDNYGEWHIDHIRPCASFDLSDAKQQKQCFHYSNLRPLWASENMSKGARWNTCGI